MDDESISTSKLDEIEMLRASLSASLIPGDSKVCFPNRIPRLPPAPKVRTKTRNPETLPSNYQLIS